MSYNCSSNVLNQFVLKYKLTKPSYYIMKSLSLGALEKYVRIKVAFGPPVDGMGPSASGKFNGGHLGGGGSIHVFMPVFCQFTDSRRIFCRLTPNFSSVHTFTSFFRPNVFKDRSWLKHGFCPKFRTFFIDIYSRPLCSLNNKNSSSPNSLRRMKTGELEKKLDNWHLLDK